MATSTKFLPLLVLVLYQFASVHAFGLRSLQEDDPKGKDKKLVGKLEKMLDRSIPGRETESHKFFWTTAEDVLGHSTRSEMNFKELVQTLDAFQDKFVLDEFNSTQMAKAVLNGYNSITKGDFRKLMEEKRRNRLEVQESTRKQTQKAIHKRVKNAKTAKASKHED